MAIGGTRTEKQIQEALLLRVLNEVAKRESLDNVIRFESRLRGLLHLRGADFHELTESQLRKRLAEQLRHAPTITPREALQPYRQLHHLGDRLGLAEIEKMLLLQIVWFASDPVWNSLSNHLDVGLQDAINVLARLWQVNPSQINRCMRADSPLFRSGLLELNVTSVSGRMEYLFEPLEGLDDSALRNPTSWRRVLNAYLPLARPIEGRKRLDFTHIEREVAVANQLLKNAQQTHRGIHLLLYGPPGTGKTSLAHLLARQMGKHLYQVAAGINRGKAHSLPRFRSYLLGQSLLHKDPQALLLFDELEDLFPAHPGRFFQDTGAFHKGWINEGLERAQVSTIWTANEICHLDASHLRRFDYVLEVPLPTRRVRRRLLQGAFKKQSVDGRWLDTLAEQETLTPAFIEQIGRLASLAPASDQPVEQVIEPVVRENLRAAGTVLPRAKATGITIPYRLDCLNASEDLAQLAAGLARIEAGRLCLHGPPGTGKTAYGKHLARLLDRPLVAKHASDLISKWLGETEKNLRQMFRQAEREGAVLLLDEADSFLQDRAHAQRSWEITQVNELLVQMEAFDGVFIATTNLMEALDAASLRRFDVKIQFGYLKPEQVRVMFLALLKAQGQRAARVNEIIARELGQLDNLTPGDFSTVARRLRFNEGKPTQEIILKVLREESFAKPDARHNPIGFTATIKGR